MKKIVIASDHAGYDLKNTIVSYLVQLGYDVDDKGTNSTESVDYPDFAHMVGSDINNGIADKGIVICGSGNGVNMTVNKYPNVRAALCWNKEIAKLARLHNDANILALPARFITKEEAIDCVFEFLTTPFEGGRHINRVKKIPIPSKQN
ncbi:MAG: ribose 5-phosphate isomerase B [Bacteroidales bacterium]|nr:ribose 5-phosphate isomerase B [Bacteroidales bacterium]